MEKLVEVGILFDFYGKILSERQYTTIEFYYIYDFSLAEIGEKLSISRQAVYDTLKRAEDNLYEYEDMLGLVDKFNCKMKEINKLVQIADEIENESVKTENQKLLSKSKDLKKIVSTLIDNSQGGVD